MAAPNPWWRVHWLIVVDPEIILGMRAVPIPILTFEKQCHQIIELSQGLLL
jgi:hypothetical protein